MKVSKKVREEGWMGKESFKKNQDGGKGREEKGGERERKEHTGLEWKRK